MRILAIRGNNLTSLAGPFEVRLDEGALRSAGLFAITGPTGSGKSTILDAMCLALFDETPRVGGKSGVEVGRADEDEKLRLRSNDPRSLVRRGAAEGAAEVDFLGNDGCRYRARWAVRRARTGKLQAQSVSLDDLDSGQQWSGTKTEVLGEIQRRLGLTFDQFCRSVLLAQGQFAAFLKASDTERAELLECMTGTEIYGRLSVKAHEREVKERGELDLLKRQRGDVQLLPDDERSALQASVVAAQERQVEATATVRATEEAERWYGERKELAAQEASAKALLAEAAQAVSDAAPLRDELVAVEAAQPLRPAVEAVDGAARAVTQAAESSALRQREAGEAAVALATARTALEAADALRTAALEERKRREPELAQAARLDAQVEGAATQAAEAAGLAERAARDATAAEEDLQLKERVREQCERKQRETADWLAANEWLQPVAKEWGLWKSQLSEYAKRSAARTAAVAALPAAQASAAESAVALSRLQTLEAEARAALEEAQAVAAAAEEEARRHPFDALHQERQVLDERLEVLRTLADAAQAARAAFEDEEESRARQTAALADAEAAEREAQQAAALAATLEAQLGEAQHALMAARSALDLSERRGELRAGEACPLCGALDHPYAHDASPIDALISQQNERVSALDSERQQTLKRKATAEALYGAHGHAAAEAAARAATRATDRLARQHTWEQAVARVTTLTAPPATATANLAATRTVSPLLSSSTSHAVSAALTSTTILHLPSLAHDDGAVTSVQQLVEGASAEREQLLEREHEAERVAKAAGEARQCLDRARVAWEGRRDEVSAGERAAVEAERIVRELRTTIEQEGAACSRIEAGLGEAFAGVPDWLVRLRPDAEKLSAAIEREVGEYQRRTDGAARLVSTFAEAEKKEAEARTLATVLRAAADELVETRRTKDASLVTLREDRKLVLDGRPTEEARAHIEAAVKSAEAAHAGALTEQHEKHVQAERKAADATTSAEAHQRCLRDQAEARRVLDDALSAKALDEATLRGLLGHDDAWRAERSQRLERIRNAHVQAESVMRDRARRRQEHEATAAPALAEEAVPDALQQARDVLKQIDGRLQEDRVRLQMDDRARATTQALDGQIKDQTARWTTWKALSDLIGSADGKKFRKFAQSLTLDVLLGHANHHLEDLSPRYRMQRVPGHDLDLQVVDLEMADEVRSIQSLSGGESFLVSLALALGLSSLASETTRVDSLFIDEGFGSLDTLALDQALASLDALQARGRQVGLISHMAGIAERIGIQVRVVPLGGGRSRVELLS